MVKDDLNTAKQQEADQGKVILEDDSLLSKGFTQVPNAVLRDPSLSDGAKLTYAMLLSYAWSDKSSFPGQERLAADLGKESRSVRRHLTELKEKGLIRVERRGMGKTNIYYVKTNFEAERTKMSDQDRTKMSSQERTKMSDKEYEESKKTKMKKTKSFRKAHAFTTEKGGEGGTAPTRSQRVPMATGKQKEETKHTTRGSEAPTQKQTPTQKRAATIESSKHRQPAYVGKPITQEEIDEKRRHGQNASGYTPLSQIPPSHWQELEAQAAAHPTNGNGNGHHAGAQHGNGLHYSSSTTRAPDFIDALMEQFSNLLHDEVANIPQNINRAAKLYRQSAVSEEGFIRLLHDSYTLTKRKRQIESLHSDGRPNKMPYFFCVLADKLGVKPNQPT